MNQTLEYIRRVEKSRSERDMKGASYSVVDVARATRLSRGGARYQLEKLVNQGKLTRHSTKKRGYYWWYFYIPTENLFRD